MDFKKTLSDWPLYLLSIILTLIILAWFAHAPGFEFGLPRVYDHDALFSGAAIKTIIDTGWYLHNPYLGAPLIYSLVDYPSSNGASYLMIKGLSNFSQQYAVVMNLFYFLTFPLVTVFSLFAFRRLGLSKSFAVVASILFAFIPYHLLRDENHLFLGTYYVVPIIVLMLFAVCSKQGLFTEEGKFSWFKWSLIILACLLSASSGEYYAFFACYFLFMAGIITCLNLKTWRPMAKAGTLIAFILLGVFINLLPHELGKFHEGSNPFVAKRQPQETENAALKISQLIMPVDGHRMHSLRKFKAHYTGTALLVNENTTSTLGIIGSIGFMLLIISLLMKSEHFEQPFEFMAKLNIAGILFATMGGFGAFFAYTISPSFRSNNRISVFIAFFSLFAFFYGLQQLLKKYNLTDKKTTVFLLSTLILLIGIFDQVPLQGVRPAYHELKQEFASDDKFVGQIEKMMPADAMVFQLPVAQFPEFPDIYHMREYELFKAYLHSHHLHWSYGAIKGRYVIVWQENVSREPLAKMVAELRHAGFSGIYIARDGYRDNAAHLERGLTRLLDQKPLESDNKKYLFYDIRDHA